VVGYQTAAGQDHYQRHSAAVHYRNSRRLSADLGVSIDSQLSMDVHVAAVCRSGYYQLLQLRPLTRSLTTAAAETVVHAFVAS